MLQVSFEACVLTGWCWLHNSIYNHKYRFTQREAVCRSLEVLCWLQHLKEQAGAQRNVLAQLAASTSLHLEPGGSYCLVPRPWLTAWRTFLGASGKRSSDAGQPPPSLPSAVAETFCTCHPANDELPGCLSVKPPAVVKRCGVAGCSPSSRSWTIEDWSACGVLLLY